MAGIVLLLLIVIAVGIYAALHSAAVHNYVLKTAKQKASQSLNTRVELQNYALHLSNLGVDLYGLTVYGVGPGANAPLLQVDHIGLGVRVISVLHRQWNLQDVAVDHPVVNMIVDSKGQSNLPTFQSSSNSNTNLFDLAVRHILLDRGTVYYNDQKTLLNADLRDLTFQSNYDATGGGRYFGTLSYKNGQLQYGSYEPMPHDLSADFDARRSGMTLNNVTLKSGDSQLLLNASVDNYSNPRLHAKYVIMLATGDFRRVLKNPSLPVGMVLVNGIADYASVPGRAPLDTASLEGTVRSSVLRVNTPRVRTDVRDLAANYHFANGNAELRDISARLLGGELRGSAMVRDLSGKQQGQVNLALHNISMADLKTIANSATLKPVAVSGHVNANAEGAWTGTISNLILKTNATANANIASAKPSGEPSTIPLNAVVHARYNGATHEITLNQSFVHTPQTSIDLNGTVSNRSALAVRVHSNDLHELETIADVFGQRPAQPLNFYGAASFDGTVRGSTKAPEIAGQLNASNLSVRGTNFRVVRTSVQASPSQVSLQNGDVELAKQGKLTFNVQSGLHDWSHLPSSPFTITANASQLSVAELAHAANVTTPVTGTLSANISAHGTQLNPIGQGELNLRNASVQGEPIQLANVHFQGTGDEVHTNLVIKLAAGTTQGQVTYYPKQEGYDAQLQAINIQLQKLESLRQRNIQASGTLNLTASGRGTLKDPQGKASLTIPELNLQKQQIRNVNLQAAVANHEATFALGSQVINTPLKAQGKVALTGDYYADASLDTPVIQLQPLLAVYSPAQAARTTGQTEIHATLRGPLKNKQLLEAHLNVPTLAVTYQAPGATPGQTVTLQIESVKPIRADYANQVVSLQPGEIKGTGTDVRFQGQLPVGGGKGPSTLSVQGGIDLALAEAFDPTLTSRGQLQFDINAAGHTPAEDVEGVIRIINASFATPDTPVGLSNANGVLTLRRDRLDITNFAGNVGGGTLTASGGVTYRPAVQFNIGIKGNDIRMLYPQSVRSDVGLNLAMVGTTDSAVLQGQVTINSLSFTPDFDLNNFINQFSGVATPPPTQGFADNLRLAVAVRSASELNVVSPTVSIQGAANLRVVGTAADPVIVGRAALTGGDVIFLGNRYIVQGGTIAFVNSSVTEPVVNLEVQTEIQQYKISMRFRGPIDRIQTNYTSDPALAQADIIHLIAFGSTEEAANAAPSQSTTQSAEALVASQVSSQVTGRLEKALGVSQISLDPQLGASTANQQQGARLTVRQRVTSKLYVTFSSDVTTTQAAAVQLQYQLSRKWSVSGVRDQNGGFGLDGRYHKSF
jgi:translocation and assembly module TamB